MERKTMPRKNVCSVCKKPVPDTLLVGRAVPPSGNHSKCSGAVVEVLDVESKKQQKTKASAAGAKAGQQRKSITGRVRQGNHDSLVKPEKSGAKGDRHANGIRQAGTAGKK